LTRRRRSGIVVHAEVVPLARVKGLCRMSTFTPPPHTRWLRPFLVVATIAMAFIVSSPARAAMPGPPDPTIPVYANKSIPAKSHPTQNAKWLAQKSQMKSVRPGIAPTLCPVVVVAVVTCGPPSSLLLSTSVVSTTLEPSADLTDPVFHVYCCSQGQIPHASRRGLV